MRFECNGLCQESKALGVLGVCIVAARGVSGLNSFGFGFVDFAFLNFRQGF